MSYRKTVEGTITLLTTNSAGRSEIVVPPPIPPVPEYIVAHVQSGDAAVGGNGVRVYEIGSWTEIPQTGIQQSGFDSAGNSVLANLDDEYLYSFNEFAMTGENFDELFRYEIGESGTLIANGTTVIANGRNIFNLYDNNSGQEIIIAPNNQATSSTDASIISLNATTLSPLGSAATFPIGTTGFYRVTVNRSKNLLCISSNAQIQTLGGDYPHTAIDTFSRSASGRDFVMSPDGNIAVDCVATGNAGFFEIDGTGNLTEILDSGLSATITQAVFSSDSQQCFMYNNFNISVYDVTQRPFVLLDTLSLTTGYRNFFLDKTDEYLFAARLNTFEVYDTDTLTLQHTETYDVDAGVYDFASFN